MRIGEVARLTGMGESALRAWERRFRLLEPERTRGGQRRYSEADVERVLTVRRLVADGLTLPTAVARVRSGDGVLPAADGQGDRLEQILQALPEGIWVGHGGVISYANRRMLELLGRTHDELIGVSAFDFVDPDDLPMAQEVLGRLQQGTRQVLEVRLVRGDGSTFLAEISASPIMDLAGRYEGSVGVVSDIGARRHEESQARFRAALLEAVGEAVIAATPGGVITYVNPAAADMFGWPASVAVGTDGYAFPTAVESAGALAEIQAQVTGGQVFSGLLPMIRRDGSRFAGHVTAAPVQDEHNRLVGLIGVIRDLTDDLRRDDELRTREIEGATVAMLGARALTRDRYTAGIEDAVVKESVEAVRRVLQADSAALLEAAPGGDWTVRATSPELGPDGATVIPGGSRSLAGYTALARTVIVVDDAEHERRFELSPLCPDTVSAIGAPVFGPRGVRAVLTAAASTTHAFDNAAHFTQAIANVVGAALQ
jgi:PAS domain S-box-containing protein